LKILETLYPDILRKTIRKSEPRYSEKHGIFLISVYTTNKTTGEREEWGSYPHDDQEQKVLNTLIFPLLPDLKEGESIGSFLPDEKGKSIRSLLPDEDDVLSPRKPPSKRESLQRRRGIPPPSGSAST
jgi:hypothetical protein